MLMSKKRQPVKPQPWIDAEIKKPIAYDIVHVQFVDGSIKNAWWAGDIWDSGKQIKKNIVRWQKALVHETIWRD